MPHVRVIIQPNRLLHQLANIFSRNRPARFGKSAGGFIEVKPESIEVVSGVDLAVSSTEAFSEVFMNNPAMSNSSVYTLRVVKLLGTCYPHGHNLEQALVNSVVS